MTSLMAFDVAASDADLNTDDDRADTASYRVTVWPVEPAMLRPLTIAGTVAGLLTVVAAAIVARHRPAVRAGW